MSLLSAIKSNKLKKVLQLIQTDYNPNETDPKTEKTLLHLTIENENHEILDLLLNPISEKQMPDLFLQDSEGNYPITLAIENGDEKSVSLLLQKKSYIFSREYPLEFSAAELQKEDILRLLIKYGGDFNVSNEEGGILHVAIREDSFRVLNYVLEELKDFDFFLKDDDDFSILFVCLEMKNFVFLQKILEKFLQLFEQDEEEVKNKIWDLMNESDINGDFLWHRLAVFEHPLLNFLKSKRDLFKLKLEKKNKKGQTYEDILNLNEENKKKKDLKKIAFKEGNKIKRIQRKEQQNLEDEEKRQNDLLLKQKILEQEKEKLIKIKEEQTMRKFYCIAFIFIFIIAMYFYIKVRIENKRANQGYLIQ